ncbi:ATP-binding protein [Siphonobacter sp. SORGH_AS_1065]|uniref:ATP-binding protein n=1 Tax=Siphonobacter sp. SORGH_AS_1065 TaxID=3041795 RepID=UPI0027826F07|nr:ATP-binding protein [Siphonobacter sp. SORGH_AS_1065]MDQ1087349.1 chemotaxis family two-component system sensor kinase Cph1 [Siphonobacter sp. SORGH_AS_1065]
MQNIDIQACEHEPIRHLGHIQAHGYLLAVDASFRVRQLSTNLEELLASTAENIINQPLQSLSMKELKGGELVQLIQIAQKQGSFEGMTPFNVHIDGREYYLVIHLMDDLYMLEFEPKNEVLFPGTLQVLVSRVMSSMQQSKSIQELLERVVVEMKAITQYDRVMIYRFDEDWNGEVAAEAKEDHLETFLGLHYPASDIPKQARELYKTNFVRTIIDSQARSVAIYPGMNMETRQPLDLSQSILRAVSPVHIEYLKNMGVRSSMSFSLLYKGELWGLISCHHYDDPRLVDYNSRMSGKMISQLLSAALEFRKDEEDLSMVNRLWRNEQILFEQMQRDWNVVQGLTQKATTVLDISLASGAALLFEGKVHTVGKTPSESQILKIADWLKNNKVDTIFHTHQFSKVFGPAIDYRDDASGMMAIVISRQLEEYLIWFKPEVMQQVAWGGNPDDKQVWTDEAGRNRLSPRKSFAKWTQLVRNTSESWKQAEINTALKIREDILQIVTQKANQIRILNEQLKLAYEELDTFSYTVSHDLRTPLASIKTYSEVFLMDYGDRLDEETIPLFEKIVSASNKMSDLIREILHYARSGRTEMSAEPLPMKDLLYNLREELLVTNKNELLTIDIGETPPIKGDKTMIMQVFTNLLTNAIKYSQTAEHPCVTVKGIQTNEEVIYSVTDNGIGIDMNQSGKVFDLFKRLDNAKEYEGHGVGLAIVKRIMQRHHGKVWFFSEPGRETTFYVSFPLA